MLKIDSHQHFWNYDARKHSWIDDGMAVLRRDFLPVDLKSKLDKAGFDGCVAVQADQSETETEFLLELAEVHPFILGVVGWLDIRADDFPQKLDTITKHPKLKGLRHIVQDEPDDRFLLRDDFLRGIGRLKDYELCYDILIYARHLPVAIEFAGKFPDQPFVVDHIAKPDIKDQKIKQWEQGIRELAQHPQMYCKLSGMVTEADWDQWKPDDFKPYLDVVFDAFGPERLMAGSDWPVCTLAAGYQEVIELVEDYLASYSEEERTAVLGENAREFYNL